MDMTKLGALQLLKVSNNLNILSRVRQYDIKTEE